MSKNIYLSAAFGWTAYACICLCLCFKGVMANWLSVFAPLVFYIGFLIYEDKVNESNDAHIMALLWSCNLIINIICYLGGNNPNWLLVFCPLLCLVLRLWDKVIELKFN